MIQIKPDPENDEGRDFYVSVIDGDRHGFLLGPYDTHTEAKANHQRGKSLAHKHDHFAAFYGFGTCSYPTKLGKLKTVFGR